MAERRSRTLLALLGIVALLTGCASIPDSGPVEAYDPESAVDRPNLDLLPDGPAPGADAQTILRGFIEAATSPSANYQVARKFLTPEFADEWVPQSAATIDRLAARKYTESGEDTWRVEATPVAGLDDAGVYSAPASEASIPLEYRFEEVDGEVRIARAPQGVLIDAANFELVYTAHPLYFYSPGYADLVPDVRWFANDRNAVQTSIVRMLVAGPAEWLRGGVVSAFPGSLRLDPDVVPVTGRVADVELTGAPMTDEAALRRMRLQLTASLADVPTVSSVRLVVNGETAESGAPTPVPDDVVRIDPRSLVYDGTTFGHLDGEEIEPVVGVSDQVAALAPTAASAGTGYEVVAVRAADGTVQVVQRGSQPRLVDDREGLLPPVVDVRGLIWTAVAGQPGTLRWTSADGAASGEVAVGWSGGRLDAFAISRDGTRLTALVTGTGLTRVIAVAVQRDGSGNPESVGEPLHAATLAGRGVDVVWADSGTVVALTADGDATTLATIELGAVPTERVGPDGGVALDAGNLARDTRVLRANGELDGSSGLGWQVRATGILAVASQLAPE